MGKSTDALGRLNLGLPQNYHYKSNVMLQVQQVIYLLILISDVKVNSRLKGIFVGCTDCPQQGCIQLQKKKKDDFCTLGDRDVQTSIYQHTKWLNIKYEFYGFRSDLIESSNLYSVHMSTMTWFGSDQFGSVQKSAKFT